MPVEYGGSDAVHAVHSFRFVCGISFFFALFERAQEFGGENITGSMQRIEEMLDTTIAAYKKQLDALFANQAADIQMDIDTMNTMLAREGLGGKGYLDIKDFMKQYEQQQSAAEAAPAPASDTSSEQTMKGSTSHG